MTKKLCVALLAAFAVVLSHQAAAGLDEEMDSLFGTMTNVSNPTAHMGARRGVITGGSVYVRAPIMAIQPVNVQFPSIKAGCGGIDIFGGSFSFINKDEFVQLLRAIAANASGYAFQLALDNMCPTCMTNIRALQAQIERLNALAKNSCDASKSLVSMAGVTPASIEKFGSDVGLPAAALKIGQAADWFKGAMDTVSGSNESKATAATREAAYLQGTTGNAVWRTLHENNNGGGISAWFQFGGHDLLLAIMSLSGTVITRMPTNTDANDPESTAKSMRTFVLPPLLKFDDLFEGVYDPNDSQQRSGRTVKVYDCPPYDVGAAAANPELQCTGITGNGDVVPLGQKSITLVGMRTRVARILIGNGPANPGIVQKLRPGGGDLTAQEKAFIQLMPPTFMPYIANIARSSPSAAESFAIRTSDVIALELTERLVDDLLYTVEVAASQNPSPQNDKVLESIKERRGEMEALRASYDRKLSNMNQVKMLAESYQKFADATYQKPEMPTPGGDVLPSAN